MKRRLVLALVAIWPGVATAQAWFVQGGAAARAEFNDNYFFTSTERQSAYTASISPFITAARRTETSDVTALLAVGLNEVWGPSPTTTYVSGRLGLISTLRDERSTWAGDVSLSRAPLLQSAQTSTGVTLVRAYTNTASVNGSYSYALTERWSVGAIAGWYGNTYSEVEGASLLSNNRGYNAGATLDYQYSERTRATAAVTYSHYSSDITRNAAVTTTLGLVHRLSPQLSLSASIGKFWSNIETTQTALVCPTTPTLCDTGVVQRVPVLSGERRRDSGPLYGGSLNYAFSERTGLFLGLSENLSPSSTGTLTKTDNVAASLSHRFSERLIGRVGLGYTRTAYPAGLSSSFTNTTYVGEIGTSFRLAERWTLEAGYQYTRAEYADNPSQPTSNFVFISVAYNWPGSSFSDWLDTRFNSLSNRVGAGPVSLPAPATTPSTAEQPSGLPEKTFDNFTIP